MEAPTSTNLMAEELAALAHKLSNYLSVPAVQSAINEIEDREVSIRFVREFTKHVAGIADHFTESEKTVYGASFAAIARNLDFGEVSILAEKMDDIRDVVNSPKLGKFFVQIIGSEKIHEVEGKSFGDVLDQFIASASKEDKSWQISSKSKDPIAKFREEVLGIEARQNAR